MFVRLKSSKNSKHPTVQIVESTRSRDGKVRQNILASLGVVRNDEDRSALLKLAHNLIQKFGEDSSGQMSLGETGYSYKAKSGKVISHEQIDYRNLAHVRDYQVGFDEVFGKISEDVGFDAVLADIDSVRKHSFSVLEVVKNVVINRLKEPESKRASFLRDLFEKGTSTFSLHHIYRAMDLILPYANKFQACAHDSAASLFPEVKSYFYDATTLFFESVTTDDLRNFGFSKDCKFNQVQVVICLLVTNEGLPVGYEIFSGNTAETKTLKASIDSLSKRYSVKSHTIVCDRGMLSNDNLNAASDLNEMFYIVGERLRKLPKKFQSEIFDESGCEFFEGTRVKVVDHPSRKNARLLIAYSEDRGKKIGLIESGWSRSYKRDLKNPRPKQLRILSVTMGSENI